ncbi:MULTISPECIES: gluconokinase [Microbacterium]|uniref:gluconokinase n=1 Tax=Microbacterium TaxID=33882 RepID=UPI00046A9734|nr:MULTISPECIES: gluconokinase [Microbacterium]
MTSPRPIVVMGVSGVGKTTVGRELAQRRAVPFIDADDLHGPANVAKMRSGTPLDDADRWPWLDRVGDHLAAAGEVVVACSALRRAYRDRLRARAPGTWFVSLVGSPARIAAQIDGRTGHYMPPDLLRSQLDTLEPLGADEAGVVIVVDDASAVLCDRIVRALP